MKSFETLGLEPTEPLVRGLREAGIAEPTAAQRQAIPPALQGRHVLVNTGTGTGKTLAYLLPLLQSLREQPGRAVVFAPGAELAMQTLRVANALKDDDLLTGAAISTSSRKRQKQRLTKSTRLVVGTPDRLIELFRTGKLKSTRLIVLDELEPILGARDAGFLDTLLARSTPKVQLLVAAATLGRRSEAFVARFMPDAVRITAGGAPLLDQVSHHVVHAPPSGKDVVLARFIQEHRCRSAIVFAEEPRLQSHLFHFLREHGIPTATLNRERTKNQRERALTAFRRREVKVLLVTDSTARGLDVPEVDWVLHYSVPRGPEAYVHRAGRTGRAGRSGRSVVFLEKREAGELKRLTAALGVRFDAL